MPCFHGLPFQARTEDANVLKTVHAYDSIPAGVHGRVRGLRVRTVGLCHGHGGLPLAGVSSDWVKPKSIRDCLGVARLGWRTLLASE
jgi:hypothetical protein